MPNNAPIKKQFLRQLLLEIFSKQWKHQPSHQLSTMNKDNQKLENQFLTLRRQLYFIVTCRTR